MATLEHDVCDVHGAFSLYIKTCWQSLYRVFPTGGMGSPLFNQKFAHSPPPHQIFISSHQKSSQPNKKIKTSFLAVASHCCCTIFVLISYSFETQIMLILILIDVQYSQNAVFSFEKFSNRQNHSSSDSHHLIKKFPQQCSLLFDTKLGKPLKF